MIGPLNAAWLAIALGLSVCAAGEKEDGLRYFQAGVAAGALFMGLT